MEADQNNCNPGLVLTIGTGHSSTAPPPHHRLRKEQIELQLWFSPESQKAVDQEQDSDRSGCKLTDEEEDANYRSSLCNQDHGNVSRKKLRLNKEQTGLLEKSFKEHSTLTPTQKRELAAKLNLRPRQVEVWFQNRRARTKLKQTEVDCEFLKRCCETLSNENRRLKKELQELRSVKPPAPPSFYFQLQRRAAECTAVCPSCERAGPSSLKSENALDGAKPQLLIGSLPDTSMAC